jgi:hypothetical protein
VAQSPEALLSDSRLSVHTLLREDMFAGFLSDNMERLAKGEKNLDILLTKRPEQKANLLSWKGQAELYRAVPSPREQPTRRISNALHEVG